MTMRNAASNTALSLDLIEPFLVEEAHLLDSRQFESWMNLFTPNGYYWAPSTPDQTNPQDHVSLIYDDHEAMETRIRRLRHPRIHSQNPPTRQTRIVGNFAVEEPGDGETGCLVRSKFLLYEFRPSVPEAQERVLGGAYWHRLVHTADGLRIASKKAVLANCDARLSPFFVYF